MPTLKPTLKPTVAHPRTEQLMWDQTLPIDQPLRLPPEVEWECAARNGGRDDIWGGPPRRVN
jgi:hypothetical protein